MSWHFDLSYLVDNEPREHPRSVKFETFNLCLFWFWSISGRGRIANHGPNGMDTRKSIDHIQITQLRAIVMLAENN